MQVGIVYVTEGVFIQCSLCDCKMKLLKQFLRVRSEKRLNLFVVCLRGCIVSIKILSLLENKVLS